MKMVNLTHLRRRVMLAPINFAVDFVGGRDAVRCIVVAPIDGVDGYMSPLTDDSHLVVVRICEDQSLPYAYKYPGIKTAPSYVMETQVEILLCTVAHEVVHCLEKQSGRRHSELRAERAAVAALKAWRERNGKA